MRHLDVTAGKAARPTAEEEQHAPIFRDRECAFNCVAVDRGAEDNVTVVIGQLRNKPHGVVSVPR